MVRATILSYNHVARRVSHQASEAIAVAYWDSTFKLKHAAMVFYRPARIWRAVVAKAFTRGLFLASVGLLFLALADLYARRTEGSWATTTHRISTAIEMFGLFLMINAVDQPLI
jgi:hypothetical protein